MNTSTTHHRFRFIGLILIAGLVLLFGETSPTLAQPAPAVVPGPALTVDAAGGYAISPDIYGMAFAANSQLAGLKLPVNRWGGNAVTRYNYQNNISNHAFDWFYENIREDDISTGLPDNSAANHFIENDNAAGTKTLLTVPTIGYVSNNNDSACGFSISKYSYDPKANDWEWRSDCGNGVNVSDVNITGNDPLDTSIPEEPSFVGGWVTYLKNRYGSNAPTYYALDNEPDLWFETHRDVHPAGAGYDELFSRGRDYALAIKAADPNARVFGPVAWGWWGYFYSAQDVANYPNWWNNSDATNPDRAAHGHQDFIPWYLTQMKNYENSPGGTRLLDYLDLHFYTQVPGVSLESGADRDTRLRSTRSLWDPTYHEYDDGSWIQAEPGSPYAPVMLIPRMRDWVNNNYPGTKLAITEYNWGAMDNIDGALAQADVLGIFGREKLDLATLWGPPSPGQPGEFAFRMYLNYDGQGGRFGNASIPSSSTDQSQLSIYGSKDTSSGLLKLMVINKTAKSLSSTLNLSNFSPKNFLVTYTYSPSNLGSIVTGWQPINGTSISYTFPAASITLLVIPPDGSTLTPPVSALPAPILKTPKNGSVSSKTVVKLVWKKVKGAQSYNVAVMNAGGGQVFTALPTKTVASAPLVYGRYAWQVTTVGQDGISAPSPANTFDVTLLTRPKNGARIKAKSASFKWKAVRGAVYSLRITKDGVALPPIDNLTKPVYKPPTPLEPGVYTWTVTVNGQTMPEWTFTVMP